MKGHRISIRCGVISLRALVASSAEKKQRRQWRWLRLQRPDPRGTGIGIAIITVILAVAMGVLSGYFNVPPWPDSSGNYIRQTVPYHRGGCQLALALSDSKYANWSTCLKPAHAGNRRRSCSQRPAPDALMLTEDENVVGVQMTVQYKVTERQVSWLFNNHDGGSHHQANRPETVIREEVGQAAISRRFFPAAMKNWLLMLAAPCGRVAGPLQDSACQGRQPFPCKAVTATRAGAGSLSTKCIKAGLDKMPSVF